MSNIEKNLEKSKTHWTYLSLKGMLVCGKWNLNFSAELCHVYFTLFLFLLLL